MALRRSHQGIVSGLLAALLFGLATPFSKELLGDLTPQALAGLLYLGAFVAVGAAVLTRPRSPETPLRRAEHDHVSDSHHRHVHRRRT